MTHDEGPRLGRKRDHSRDGDILDAALEVLAEAGYVGMTMDMVALRAKAGKATMYRRWPSKAELVLDALARMKTTALDLDRLPDTGTLRGDLLALFKPRPLEESERTLNVMKGLASMLSQDARFADAVTDMVMTPFADAHHVLMRRARERKEIAAGANLEVISRVLASMAGFRSIIEGKPFTREFLVSMVDDVLLPALGAPPATGRKPTAKPRRSR